MTDENTQVLEEISSVGLDAMGHECQRRGLSLEFAFSTIHVGGLSKSGNDCGTGSYGDRVETELDLLAELLGVCRSMAKSLGVGLDVNITQEAEGD